MATFKLVVDDKVKFYEIEIIREVDNTLVLQLKHFNHDLTGWEKQNETEDFPLKLITKNKVEFEGLTFERLSSRNMIVSVIVEDNQGKTETLVFNYTKE